jgi:hypothetical protein
VTPDQIAALVGVGAAGIMFVALVVLGCMWRRNVRQLRLERDTARKIASEVRLAAVRGRVGDDRAVYDRNTEKWLTPEMRDELDARFDEVISSIGGES